MEITGAEREIGGISDNGNKNGGTCFKKPGSYYVDQSQIVC